MKLFIGFFILLISVSSSVLAQIPKTMSYQGVLADTGGSAVADGNYSLTFRIYDAASGGTEIWVETQTIPVVDGIFNAILGSATPLNLAFDRPYWLGVSVDGGTELSPRIELTSAPYSLEPDSGSGGNGDGHSLDAADGDPVDAVYVDNNGNVGIGTTNPAFPLSLGSSLGYTKLALYETGLNNNYGIGIGAGAFILHLSGSQARFAFFDSDDSNANEVFTIKGNGKVGIGRVSPHSDTKLHVESNDLYAGYFISDSLSYDTHVIHAELTATGQNDAIAGFGRSAPELQFGIGGKFEGGYTGVYAVAEESGIGLRYGLRGYGANGEINHGIFGQAFGGTTNYGVYGLGSGGSSNNYGVYASGNLAYTGSLIHVSDSKFKENIRPLSGSLNKLMKLKPKSFNYTSDEKYAHMNLPTGEHYGLIAQEVEQVLPELVSDNSHPSATESRGEKSDDPPINYMGLDYMELIPVLIEAVKEQQTIIEKQQEEINQLKSKVNQLTNN